MCIRRSELFGSRLKRAGTSIVLQGVSKLRPTWNLDMTWERHQGLNMTASCNQTKLKKSLHEVQEIFILRNDS